MFAATLKGAQLPIEAFIWWPLPKMSLSWTIFPLNKFPVPDFGREKTHCAFFHWEFPGMNMAQNKSPMFFSGLWNTNNLTQKPQLSRFRPSTDWWGRDEVAELVKLIRRAKLVVAINRCVSRCGWQWDKPERPPGGKSSPMSAALRQLVSLQDHFIILFQKQKWQKVIKLTHRLRIPILVSCFNWHASSMPWLTLLSETKQTIWAECVWEKVKRRQTDKDGGKWYLNVLQNTRKSSESLISKIIVRFQSPREPQYFLSQRHSLGLEHFLCCPLAVFWWRTKQREIFWMWSPARLQSPCSFHFAHATIAARRQKHSDSKSPRAAAAES